MPNEPDASSQQMNDDQSNSGTPPTEPHSGEQTAAQLDALTQTQQALIDQVNTLMSQPQPSQPQYQQPVTAANYQYQQPQTHASNPDLWYTDPAAAEQNLLGRIGQAMQQYVGATSQPLVQSSIENARHLSMHDPKMKTVWDKYGGEIDKLVNNPQISPQFRASKAVWDQAAQLVASQHLDEIAQERAQELALTMQSGTELGNSVGYASSSPQENSAMQRIKDTAWGGTLIDKYGERKVLENCEKAGWTLDQYATMCEQTNATRDPDKPGQWTNDTLTDPISRDV